MLSPLKLAALPNPCRGSTRTAKLRFHRSLIRVRTPDGRHARRASPGLRFRHGWWAESEGPEPLPAPLCVVKDIAGLRGKLGASLMSTYSQPGLIACGSLCSLTQEGTAQTKA